MSGPTVNRHQRKPAHLQVVTTLRIENKSRCEETGTKPRRTITGPLTVAENPHPHLINHEDFQFLSFLFAETIDNLVSITLFGVDAMMLELIKGTTKMEVCRAIQVATDQEFVLGGRSDRSAAVVHGSLVPFDSLRCLCSVGIRLPVQVWHLQCRSQFPLVVEGRKDLQKVQLYPCAWAVPSLQQN
jgi:hypothetical protein